MAFVIDKQELKPGLVIFRRGDVDHKNWYCRIKLPKADRYKTHALKTSNIEKAKADAWEYDADVRADLRKGYSVFNRPFSQVAKEYADLQDARVKNGEINAKRAELVRSVVELQLNRYVGTTQVHLIGPERWSGYPAWRRNASQGRIARLGNTRPFTDEEKAAEDARYAAAMETYQAERKRAALSRRAFTKKEPVRRTEWVIVSDATIRTEMSIFRAIMAYAISKRFASADKAFGEIPDQLEVMRRDEFTREEYAKLHSVARAWIREASATRPASVWYRTVAYNFMLIMCNTGMRPPEAKNLRWRDISHDTDREGRKIVVLWVHGKDKRRRLVAPEAVGEYFERIRKVTRELRPKTPISPEQPVFTAYNGTPAESLYASMVEAVLKKANLLLGPTGVPRGNYCFRHTYATLRLSEGIDVYFLADQMGTSVKMIEQHYGHVNTIKHADRVLSGMYGWDPEGDDGDGTPLERASSARDKKRSRVNAAARQAIKTGQPKPAAPPVPRGPRRKSS